MRVFRFLMFLCVLLTVSPALHAQYTAADYLNWTNQHLDRGNCDEARETYALYKEKVPQGNAEVERRIAECGRLEDLTFHINGVKFKMIHVEGGALKDQEDVRYGNSKSVYDTMVTDKNGNMMWYSVTLNCSPQSQGKTIQIKDFYIGEYEITQELWFTVMSTTIYQQRDKEYNAGHLYGVGPRYPMYHVSYYEAQEFCKKLNMLFGKNLPNGYRFALPTGYEWEYAARGGSLSNAHNNTRSQNQSDESYNRGSSNESTHVVGSKLPNPLGLFDMPGNVSEWCDDMDDLESTAMIRGSSWISSYGGIDDVSWGTASARCGFIGFRLALVRR